jgi:hypothetical protein
MIDDFIKVGYSALISTSILQRHPTGACDIYSVVIGMTESKCRRNKYPNRQGAGFDLSS